MRISRLFTPELLNVGQQIEIDEDNAHYVRTVLRLKKGQLITLFNGMGGEYSSILAEVSRKRVAINIKEKISKSVESPLSIYLGLGISRGDRMDWAIQKAVELGVYNMTPLKTERCVVKFKADKARQKLQHWRNIVQHAAEQSGRTTLPEVSEIETMQDWMKEQSGLKIFLDPYAQTSLVELKPENNQVTLLSGPEGGFSQQEKEMAETAGFIPVQMGARILRTETASLAAISAVQTLWGDFAICN